MPICGKKTNDKSLENSSKQEQEVDDKSVAGKKAQQAIVCSLKGSRAAMILFVSPGNVMTCS